MDYESQMQWGKDMYERGEYRTARIEFTGAAVYGTQQHEPQDRVAEAWYWLGNAERQMGHHQKAIDAYRKALVLCPDNTTYGASLTAERQAATA